QFLSRFQVFDNEVRAAEDATTLHVCAKDKTALSDSPFTELPFYAVDSITEYSTFPSPQFLEKTRSVLGNMDGDHPPSIDFALPEKPCLETIGFHREHLVLEVTSFHNAIRRADYIFPPPPLPALNEFYARELWYFGETVR